MADDKSSAPDGNKQLKGAAAQARNAQGLYNVEFLKDHGSNKKGSKGQMHLSTAKALEHHKVVNIGEKVKVVEKKKR